MFGWPVGTSSFSSAEHGIRVALARAALQRPELLQQNISMGYPSRPNLEDRVLTRRFAHLVLPDQFLVQLLAGPRANRPNQPFLFQHEPRQPDQIPGPVHHLARLAHLEDNHRAATATAQATR